ncbi:hypothetical protein F5Y06DRAFT_302425 [Hypoxylon sp. FL0890]|nr:hypothetical protein F5Y06DRAFT_302425 [Hypoxylon sp. FL0890]
MSIGPLTTTFTPPADCLSQGVGIARYSTAESYNYYLTAGPSHSTCFPSSSFPVLSSYYSPGICPYGYSAACSYRNTYSFGSTTETTVTCCPTSLFSFDCNTKPVGTDWGVFADCTATTSDVTIVETIATAIPSSKFSTVSYDSSGDAILNGSVIVNGYGIQVRWQSTDEALWSTSPRSTSSITSTIPSATSTASQTPLPTAQIHTASSSLSTGAIVGACIGAIAGFAILVGIVIWIVQSKRKKRKEGQDQPPVGQNSDNQGFVQDQLYPTTELPASGARRVFPKHELPVPAATGIIPRQELQADSARSLSTDIRGLVELPDTHRRELEG